MPVLSPADAIYSLFAHSSCAYILLKCDVLFVVLSLILLLFCLLFSLFWDCRQNVIVEGLWFCVRVTVFESPLWEAGCHKKWTKRARGVSTLYESACNSSPNPNPITCDQSSNKTFSVASRDPGVYQRVRKTM